MREQYGKAFFEVDHGGCYRSVVEFGECDRICCVSRNVKVSGNVTAQLPEAVSFHLYPLFPENAGRSQTSHCKSLRWPPGPMSLRILQVENHLKAAFLTAE